MTKQLQGATVRETHGLYCGRPVVAEIHPGVLVLRLKGTKQTWHIDWASLADVMEMRAAKALCGDITPRKGGRR